MTAALSLHPDAGDGWDSKAVSRIVRERRPVSQSPGRSVFLLALYHKVHYLALNLKCTSLNNSWSRMFIITKTSVFFPSLCLSFRSLSFSPSWAPDTARDWYGNYSALALIYLVLLLVAAPTTILGCRTMNWFVAAVVESKSDIL